MRDSERSSSQPPSPQVSRLRDFAVLTLGALALLVLLALTNAMGVIEAIAGAIALSALALAYYVGTSPQQRDGHLNRSDRSKPITAQSDPMAGASLLHAMPLPAFEADAAGRIIANNQAAIDVLRLDTTNSPRASAAIRNTALLEAIATAGAGASQPAITFSFADGPDRTWRAHVVGLPDRGSVLTVLEDLTPVRRAEQARTDFLANASHELRTPLTSIAGFIETMRGPAQNDVEDWPRFLDIMHGETDRMSRLIDDLLSLSRIEFSEHQPPKAKVDLAALARMAGEAMRPLALERDIDLVTHGDNSGLMVTGNADELTQIVQNLLENAIKYTPHGGKVVLAYGVSERWADARRKAGQEWPAAARMTLLSAPARGEELAPAIWLRVTDTGPGIARQHLPRLGERFYRVDESRGDSIPGTGLGLAIAKHIMARHRGGLCVESREGQGSAFGIWMSGVHG